MNSRVQLIWLALGAVLCSAGFGPCHLFPAASGPPAPVVFFKTPTLEEIVQYRNMNAAQVRQLQASGATLSVRGAPSLRADLALETPKRFRLRAGTAFTGSEMDMGSNDDLFWIWVKRNQPPAIYYARHDQFQNSPAKEFLPVEPHWLSEALGLVSFDPSHQHQGPFPAGPGRLEIRSVVPSPAGALVKATVIHEQYGYVLEQRVYDAKQKLLAAAFASQHRFDPQSGVALPYSVDVQIPPAQLAFTLEVNEYSINRLYDDPAQLWAMPQIEGAPAVDLADPRMPRPGQVPAGYTPAPPAGLPGAASAPPSYPPPSAAPVSPPVGAPSAPPIGPAPTGSPYGPASPFPGSGSFPAIPQAERPRYFGERTLR